MLGSFSRVAELPAALAEAIKVSVTTAGRTAFATLWALGLWSCFVYNECATAKVLAMERVDSLLGVVIIFKFYKPKTL